RRDARAGCRGSWRPREHRRERPPREGAPHPRWRPPLRCYRPADSMGASVPDSPAALDAARRLFAAATGFTTGVEEELQILDPATLGMVNRFQDVKAAADATPLGPFTAGELIASEVEIKTGRCETFAEAAGQIRDRRRALFALGDQLGLTF